MKVLKKIFIGIIILFFMFTLFLSFLLLNKNEYGAIEIGDKLYLPLTFDNGSNYLDDGSLVVISKIDFSNININDNIFIYKAEDDTSLGEVVYTKVSDINFDEKYILSDGDSKYYGEEFIAGVLSNSYDNIGGILSILLSKWFFFFVILVPCFLVVLYEVYLIIIRFKFDDDTNINTGDDNSEVQRLKLEVEKLRSKLENNDKEEEDNEIVTTSLDNNELDIDDSEESLKEDVNKETSVDADSSDLTKEEDEKNDNFEKSTLIGDKESNPLKKGLIFISEEVKELLILFSFQNKLCDTYLSSLKKIINCYINDKYYGDNRKYNSSRILDYDGKEEIKINLKLINNIIDNPSELDLIISGFDDDKREYLKNGITKILDKYNNIINSYLKKIDNKFFKYEEEVIADNIVNVKLVYNDKKDNIYSDIALSKALDGDVLKENMTLLKLRMTSLKILENLIYRKNSSKKYIVFFPDSLFLKERKRESFFDAIDDIILEDKIIILLSYNTFTNNIDIIKKYIRNGYKFGTVVSDNKLDDNIIYLDYLFILGEENKERYLSIIPQKLKENYYVINSPLVSEGI